MIQNFIIHVGTYKTGTTSIQQQLLKHEKQLNFHDIYVIDRERDLPEVSKWLFPNWYEIEDEAAQESKAIHQILSLKKSIITHENIIYSEENFTDIMCIEEQQKRVKKLNFIIEMFSARSNTAHVFFRDPESLLLSWYKQLTRNRNYNYSDYQSFIEQNLQKILKACDWDEYENRLQHILGTSKLVKHDFQHASKQGLTQYFFNTILNIDSIKIKEEKHNESQSDLTTKLLESVSKLAINKKLSSKNIGWLKQAIFEMKPVNQQKINNLTKKTQTIIQKLKNTQNFKKTEKRKKT